MKIKTLTIVATAVAILAGVGVCLIGGRSSDEPFEQTVSTTAKSSHISTVLDRNAQPQRKRVRFPRGKTFPRGGGKSVPDVKVAVRDEAENLLQKLEDARLDRDRARVVEELLELIQKGGLLDPPSTKEKFSRAEALRMLTDLGRNRATMAVARTLRHSSNRSERKAALDAFAWVGADAMLEITSMLADSDPAIAAEAMETWTQSLEEVSDDTIKCELIKESVKVVDDANEMEGMLLELAQVEQYLAVETLDGIIIDGEAPDLAKSVAKEVYEHLCDDAYVSHDESVALAETLRKRREETALSPEDAAALKLLVEQLMQDAAQKVQSKGL